MGKNPGQVIGRLSASETEMLLSVWAPAKSGCGCKIVGVHSLMLGMSPQGGPACLIACPKKLFNACASFRRARPFGRTSVWVLTAGQAASHSLLGPPVHVQHVQRTGT